jgi:hypothetical protein
MRRPLGITAVIFGGVTLGSCATPLATSAETDGPIRAEVACLAEAAKNLDDQTSDAATVAYGLMGRCDREIRQAIEVASKGLSFEGRQTLRTRVNQEILKSTTGMVLELRSRRAQSKGGA